MLGSITVGGVQTSIPGPGGGSGGTNRVPKSSGLGLPVIDIIMGLFRVDELGLSSYITGSEVDVY